MNEVMTRQVEEVVNGGDLIADARTMVSDMIQNMISIQERLNGQTGPQADKLRKETERLLSALRGATPGIVDVACFLNRQPKEDREFGYPGRALALCGEARPRLHKSRYMFPDPVSVVNAVAVLSQDVAPENAGELQIRVAFYMARMNMSQDGMAASTAMRRIIQAASLQQLSAHQELTVEQSELLASAKGALAAFLFEARRRGRR